VRLTFGFCDGYRPRRPGLHGPQCQHGRRPDLLSPYRGDLRLARAAFDRKPRLWPDCRFVVRPQRFNAPLRTGEDCHREWTSHAG
jgi:hypothetical protein